MRLLALITTFIFSLGLGFVFGTQVLAQTFRLPTPTPTPTPISVSELEVVELEDPQEVKSVDFTQETEETVAPLERELREQQLGNVFPWNPVKYAIRNAIAAGVAVNTIVLLLLLPIVASVIAAMRHFIGIRGFGIFLPAALSLVFLATGPVSGIFLFVIILVVATLGRIFLKKLRIKLQYLPRMALLLWMVSIGVLAVLFAAPLLPSQISSVSIFPILILVLLAESFLSVQISKSANEAIGLTVETVILALISFILLSLEEIRRYVLLQPEVTLIATAFFDWFIGHFVGLRLMELWKFRKLVLD